MKIKNSKCKIRVRPQTIQAYYTRMNMKQNHKTKTRRHNHQTLGTRPVKTNRNQKCNNKLFQNAKRSYLWVIQSEYLKSDIFFVVVHYCSGFEMKMWLKEFYQTQCNNHFVKVLSCPLRFWPAFFLFSFTCSISPHTVMFMCVCVGVSINSFYLSQK